jgi:hemerythrin-like domain-containing protein
MSRQFLVTPMAQAMNGNSSLARDPLEIIAHDHILQIQICDAMERIADGLPDDIDRRLCVQVATCLKYDLPIHHLEEETGLFPLLLQRADPARQIGLVLDRLASEHDMDAEFAGEIAESLDLLGRGERVTNSEMIGYMLRGFFERYRRHIHWEEELVMPIARECLSAVDLNALSKQMEEIRQAHASGNAV